MRRRRPLCRGAQAFAEGRGEAALVWRDGLGRARRSHRPPSADFTRAAAGPRHSLARALEAAGAGFSLRPLAGHAPFEIALASPRVDTLNRSPTMNSSPPHVGPLSAPWRACSSAAQPLAQLAARLYVAQAFFAVGPDQAARLGDHAGAVRRRVPGAAAAARVAAVLGTAGELVLPVLLALGLGGRFAAAGCRWSTRWRWSAWPRSHRPRCSSMCSGAACCVGLVLWGPGRWSLDRFVGVGASTSRDACYTRAA